MLDLKDENGALSSDWYQKIENAYNAIFDGQSDMRPGTDIEAVVLLKITALVKSIQDILSSINKDGEKKHCPRATKYRRAVILDPSGPFRGPVIAAARNEATPRALPPPHGGDLRSGPICLIAEAREGQRAGQSETLVAL